MKFVCNQSDLTKALSTVSRAVTSRTTIPILKGILINAENEDFISLTASDLDISIETRINASVSERGSIVLPSKLFGDAVRKLPQGNVSFQENENGNVDIKCLKTNFKIMGIPADEFPKIYGNMDGERISLEKKTLREMIRKTCFAAGTDETRGIITGVLMELKKGMIHMVALDGFRMAVVREKTKNEDEKSIIIPAGIMSEVGRIMSDAEESKPAAPSGEKEGEEIAEKEDFFEILTDGKKAVFDLKNTVVVSRLLEGSFVKYEDILPKEFKTSLLLNKNEIKDSVERASVLIREGKNNFIKIEILDGRMVLTSRNEEGSFRDEIATDQKGDDLEIGFNAKFIADALKAVSDEEIRMEFNTSVTPCLIRPTEGNAYEYLVLPVRLASG
ncbi:MAG: DNA polymerase III subunit beta [Clostridiales Family XIII bacterium]|jgi:DNA polymerase-3 subunit beta|nr:DNA polymerase III subunit beta [Clostridiales Family XIII bacterium]